MPVPSLFFIGENGTPLEIVAGSTTATELAAKIDNVLLKAGKTNKEFSLNLIDAEQKAAAAASSSSNDNSVEATAPDINNAGSNPNTDLTSTIESRSSLDDKKDPTVDTVQAATSSNTENQNNNEASKNDTETAHGNPNVELTPEVRELSKI